MAARQLAGTGFSSAILNSYGDAYRQLARLAVHHGWSKGPRCVRFGRWYADHGDVPRQGC